MDAGPLQGAYRALLDAAATVARSGDPGPVPPAGEWNAEQILAHVSLITAVTLAAVSSVAAGANTTYDNRMALDTWTIERLVALVGGDPGLRDRVRLQGDALCALCEPMSDAELDTPVPTRLLSKGTVLVDRPMPLRDLLTGLAEVEVPGHRQQLLSLLPGGTRAGAAP